MAVCAIELGHYHQCLTTGRVTELWAYVSNVSGLLFETICPTDFINVLIKRRRCQGRVQK